VRLFSPMRMNAVPSTTSSPFSVAAPARSSLPRPTVGDVAHADRDTAARRDHDLTDLRRGAQAPGRVDQVLLALVRDEAADSGAVVRREREHDVGEREP
jgi:hypothetical protein